MHQVSFTTLKRYIQKDDYELMKNEIHRFSQVDNQVHIINKKDEHGDTLVHFAARYHAKNALKILVVEFGGDVTSVNIHGRQPLHEAIEDLECVQFLCRQPNIDIDCMKPMKGRLDIVKELTSKGANDKLLNKDGWNSLHLATKEGHLDVVKFLHKKSPESSLSPSTSGRLPIQTAALCNHPEIVYYFLVSSSRDSIKFLLSANDNSGLDLLQNAVISGNLELVQRLIVEYGASIMERDKLGRQTIHHAAMTGNIEVARYLVIHCCEITKNKNEEKVKFVNVLDEWDMWTPLHYASKQGYEEMGLSSFIFGAYAITVELAIPLIIQQELYGILCLVCHVQCLYYKYGDDERAERQPLIIPENETTLAIQYDSTQCIENKAIANEKQLSRIRQAKYFALFFLWILGFGLAQYLGVGLLKNLDKNGISWPTNLLGFCPAFFTLSGYIPQYIEIYIFGPSSFNFLAAFIYSLTIVCDCGIVFLSFLLRPVDEPGDR
ncbi:7977_t:CDS:2 [Ambispora gerdemannii]|uniref:7977_t:CDS:1 n=1 Tax=Ambispora gerdemannii TaxID=144530 RepID=A0A9N9AY30_9GLOM|nr:7977_t:CDS:2 [Ambispora gerdemannii]